MEIQMPVIEIQYKNRLKAPKFVQYPSTFQAVLKQIKDKKEIESMKVITWQD